MATKQPVTTHSARLFTPIDSMNPLYMTGGETLFAEVIAAHGGATLAEIKEDGYRVQVHKRDEEVRAYTRSKNPLVLELYPEVIAAVQHLPDCILDAELVGKGLVGKAQFDAVKRRFRPKASDKVKEAYLASSLIADAPLELRVFDTLRWEQRSLLGRPLTVRRQYTERIDEPGISPSTQRRIAAPEELHSWFDGLVGANYEGLVCKNPASIYLPGGRTTDWVKLKRSETFDLVVLGAYLADGNVAHLLCGTYNAETGLYETLAKVNAARNGLNQGLDAVLAPGRRDAAPPSVALNPAIATGDDCQPSYFIEPLQSIVVEVAAMNVQRSRNWHSCGLAGVQSYSLRIGWLKSIREDKGVNEIATTASIAAAYLQSQPSEGS